MDDPKNRGPRDRSRVNTEQEYEVGYWSEEFGVTAEELKRAVQAVGSSTERVR